MIFFDAHIGGPEMTYYSATKLSKGASCGRWAGDYPTPGVDAEIEPQNGVSDAVKDGNLRHALLEYFLKNFAAESLSLNHPDIWSILSEQNWVQTVAFLEGLQKPLPDVTLLHCKKILKNWWGPYRGTDSMEQMDR